MEDEPPIANREPSGEEIMKRFIATVRSRVRRDKDCWIAVTGQPGTGKSTFSFILAMLLDEGFSSERIAMDGDRFIDIAEKTPRFGVVINDEPISGFFSRESMSKENRAAQRWSWIMRARNHIVIVNMNELRWADSMLEPRLHFVAHIEREGVASLFAPVRIANNHGLHYVGTKWAHLLTVTYGQADRYYPEEWERYQKLKYERMRVDVRRMKTPRRDDLGEGEPVGRKGQGLLPCRLCSGHRERGGQRARIGGKRIRVCVSCENQLHRHRSRHGRSSAPPDMIEKAKAIGGVRPGETSS